MTSKDMLEVAIEEIFNKALAEPAFGGVYSEMCAQISKKMADAPFASVEQLPPLPDPDAPPQWGVRMSVDTAAPIAGSFSSREDAETYARYAHVHFPCGHRIRHMQTTVRHVTGRADSRSERRTSSGCC